MMMSLDFFSVSCLQNRKRRLYRMSCRCHFWYGIEENPGGKVLSMEKCAIFFSVFRVASMLRLLTCL